MKHWLFGDGGRAYLLEEYVARQRSTYAIALDQKTYANQVRRALMHHGIKLRDKSKAQAAALASGRHAHPTKGRERTAEERAAISDGLNHSQTE